MNRYLIPVRWLYRKVVLFLLGLSGSGKNILVHPSVRIDFPHNIVLCSEVHVHRGSEMTTNREGKIFIGYHSRIDHHVSLIANDGSIKIGENSYIGAYSILRGDGNLMIGNDVLCGPNVVIMSANHIFADRNKSIRLQGETHKGIVIEDDVWLGSSVNVLDGVCIGQGTVVGAGSVVTRDLPPYSIAVGAPARVIKQR